MVEPPVFEELERAKDPSTVGEDENRGDCKTPLYKMGTVKHRRRVRQQYKDLLRAAETLPEGNRREWTKYKIRTEIRKNMHETNWKEVDQHIILGDTNLDSIKQQVQNVKDMAPDAGTEAARKMVQDVRTKKMEVQQAEDELFFRDNLKGYKKRFDH